MPRKYAGIAGFALLVAAAGCSLVTDLNGFADAPDAGPAGIPSSSSDSAAPAATTPDAATEAATPPANKDAAGPAPATPCEGTHFFCTDFDKRALAQEWEVIAPGDGTIDRNMGAAQSAPFSLEMTHPVGNPAAPIVATTLPAPGIGGLTCSFSYRRDEVDDAGVLVVLIADFNTAGAEHLFAEIKDGKNNGRVYLAATAPDGKVTDDFPVVPTFSTTLGAWATVKWTLDLRAKRSTLTSNAKVIDQRSFGAFTPANLTTVKLTLGLGNFTAPTAPWRVRYDNFVCDALP